VYNVRPNGNSPVITRSYQHQPLDAQTKLTLGRHRPVQPPQPTQHPNAVSLAVATSTPPYGPPKSIRSTHLPTLYTLQYDLHPLCSFDEFCQVGPVQAWIDKRRDGPSGALVALDFVRSFGLVRRGVAFEFSAHVLASSQPLSSSTALSSSRRCIGLIGIPDHGRCWRGVETQGEQLVGRTFSRRPS
jgi:hypothetical protein